MRNQGFGIRWIWVNAKAYDVSVFSANLYVISRLQLTIEHAVFLHPHKSSVMVCFGITVTSLNVANDFLVFVFPWKDVFLNSLAFFFNPLSVGDSVSFLSMLSTTASTLLCRDSAVFTHFAEIIV